MKRINLTLNNLFYFVMCFSFYNNVLAQSVARESISSLGNNVLLQNISISQTVGQPYSLNTAQLSNFQLYPGFQQSILLVDDFELTENVSLYPNPCINKLHLNLVSPPINQEILFSIYNSMGIKICTHLQSVKDEIDVSNINSGVYILQYVLDGKNQSVQFIIIK
jgi:hypothetical protein